MQTLANPQTKQAFIHRINQLTPHAPAQWGKMSVDQMLKHLSELVQLADGTRTLPANPFIAFVSWLFGGLIKNRLINNDRPLPRNLGKAPLPVSRGFEAEKQALIERLNRFDLTKTSAKPVPLFGKLSPNEWDTFLSKQFEHHLTQFSV